MRATPFVPVLLVLAACHNDADLIGWQPPVITIDSPAYGAFLGWDGIDVVGHVSPAMSSVKIDGEWVPVAADGSFTAHREFTARYHVLDVQAGSGPQLARVRVPVFDGHNPVENWPGGVTLRVTPDGLQRLGDNLGALVDATGWDTQIASVLPAINTAQLTLTPNGVTHDPSAVVLNPTMGGINAGISLRNLQLNYLMGIDLFGTPIQAPVEIAFSNVQITALAVPAVDDAGMLTLAMNNAAIDMGEPTVNISGINDFGILEFLVGLILDYIVEPLGAGILDLAVSQIGTLELGGPFAFSTDLLGTQIDVRLSDIHGDPFGLGGGIGVGLNEPAPVGPLSIPTPIARAEPEHLQLGVHEGLLQLAMDGLGVTSLLKQDIQLAGPLGEVLGAGIRALPGADTMPFGDGFCLALDPNPQLQPKAAQVVRMSANGVQPLATLYLPDLGVNASVLQGGFCTPWLQASMVGQIDLVIRHGTAIGVDIHFPEGAVLYYGATSEWDEAAVIAGLSSFIEGAVGLFGGSLEFDLADILGGLSGGTGTDPLSALFGDIAPQIITSEPLVGADGQPVEGMAQIGLQLWATE